MIRKYGLYAIWVISMLVTFGSLYLNEIQYWQPCKMRCYQYVCMYPLAIIAGIAAWRGFLGIARYVLPQTLIGLGLSIYQMIIEFTQSENSIHPIKICTKGHGPENGITIGMNLKTIAILSLISFLLINILLFLVKYVDQKETHAPKKN